jgi:SAM-dependent methyltransferase
MRDPQLEKLARYSGDPWGPKNEYFARAEAHMDNLWAKLVWPFIGDCDFTAVVDLAAGHGRNSEKLLPLVGQRLHITDIQAANVAICAERFRDSAKVNTFVGNGYDFRPLEDSSVTLVYCFDAMVHFDSDVVRSYLKDSMRVLKPGGRAFFHHSNYTGGHDWRTNPGARNFMSAALFEHYALKEGLSVVRQKVIDWQRKDHDCVTLVEKPAAAAKV